MGIEQIALAGQRVGPDILSLVSIDLDLHSFDGRINVRNVRIGQVKRCCGYAVCTDHNSLSLKFQLL